MTTIVSPLLNFASAPGLNIIFPSLCDFIYIFFATMTTTIHFSGLNTEPVILIRPASDFRFRVYLWTSLLTRRLRSGQVGLSRHLRQSKLCNDEGNCRFLSTHWVTLSNFKGFTPYSIDSNLTWYEQRLVSRRNTSVLLRFFQ